MTDQDNVGKTKLRSYAERLTRLLDEQTALGEDIKAVRQEAASDGYNVKALNKALKLLAMTVEKREEAEQLELEIDLYVTTISGEE